MPEGANPGIANIAKIANIANITKEAGV